MDTMTNFINALNTRSQLLSSLSEKLQELEMSKGSSTTIYAKDVIVEDPPVVGKTNIQLALNDIYAKFGDMSIID